MANEDSVSSKLNLVKRDFDGTVFNGTVTFTQWQGWIGVDGCISTGFNDSTDGITSTLNSVHWGAYSRTDNTNNDGLMGLTNSTLNKGSMLVPTLIGGRFYYSLHTTYGASWVANTTSLGFFLSSRTASNVTKAYRNGDSLATASTVSTQLYNGDVICVGQNNDGLAPCTREISFISIGAGLTSIEVRKLNNCVEAYLDGIGVGVQ